MSMKKKRNQSTLKADIYDQLLADDVKKGIDIVSLFSSFGVQLTQKGSGFIGHCPFHADQNPSLSVDRSKGLFNCFGCGESGDVISLVQKMKGLDFKAAMDYLKNGGIVTKNPAAQPQPNQLKKPVITEKSHSSATIFQAEITLNDIAQEYHKNLIQNSGALDYLCRRGFKDPGLFKDFQIGYCSGSLKDKLSRQQFENLISRGIFRDNGREFFLNCLVIPIFDEHGRVVHFYGRNIHEQSTVKHLYLKGSHKSIFNIKAIKVYNDQLVLTESLLDALSLVQLGIKNVVACYGVNGFTDQLLELLKRAHVKELLIGFDQDEAGRKGAEKLKSHLLDEGFSVRMIFPLQGKDWNEALLKGMSDSDFQNLVSGSEVEALERSGKMSYEKKGDTYYFKAAGLTYRVLGFKGNFSTELKLNFRCYYEGSQKSLSRVFNLYAGRAVDLYVHAICQEFSLSSDLIRAHFEEMTLIFEDEREKLLEEKSSSQGKTVYLLTHDEEKAALDLLTGSDIIHDHLLPDTEKIGLVGETMNKIICYHAIISRLWRKPVNICTLSLYGMGKSFLHDTMHRFVPDEDLKDYSRITKNDLYYREDKDAFVGKILSIDEVEGIADSLYSIRTLISKGYLSISYPAMDPVSGKMRNEENKIFGRPSVFVTGTNDEKLDEETLSRFVICSTDSSNDQRHRIKQRQLFEMTEKGLKERRFADEIVTKHKNVLRMIKKIEVVFPASWSEKLTEIETGTYSSRNNLCYLSFIACSAIRDQYNRPVYTGDDVHGQFKYVEISKEDIKLANRIMKELFGKRVRDLKPPQMHFFSQFQKLAQREIRGKNLGLKDISFYEKDLREFSGLSYWQVNRYLNDLVRMEYVGVDSRGQCNQKKYKLLIDDLEGGNEKYLSGLIDPAVL